MAKAIFRFFSSLELTVWLLAAALVLVLFGTLEQVHLGIFAAQEKYFQSIIAIWAYPAQWPFGSYLQFLHLPVPGGYLVGGLMLANLGCAHFRYFRLRWQAVGIALIHLGLATLLISELLTNLLRDEHYLWFEEGQTASHLTSYHEDELFFVDRSPATHDQVVAFPIDLVRGSPSLAHPLLPFRVQVRHLFDNAVISRGGGATVPVATRGLAPSMGLVVQPVPRTFKTNERNTVTAIVEIETDQGSLGTWLVSNVFESNLPSQEFEYEGRTFELGLRYRRQPLPFSMRLIKFTHDRYPGTNIPRNFASRIHLTDPGAGQDREALIYMNNPLRYGGFTFYQSSFGRDSMGREDRASQLQVVRNPGWLVPYFACVLMTAGLLWQFGYGLWRFLQRDREPRPAGGEA